jgi:hypothetical protein
MKREHFPRFCTLRGLCLVFILIVSLTIISGECLRQSVANAQDVSDQKEVRSDAFTTTLAYVVQFYPLWFTYYQSVVVPLNVMAGPDRISPIYHIVVAINDDTLYASSLLNLMDQPMILTIPATTATYSILTLDAYGNVFDTDLVAGTPGTYGLTGPGWTGTLPDGVTPIAMPLNYSALIFRADKFSGTVDNTTEASAFRESLRLATLSDYEADHTAGAARIYAEIAFSAPFKTVADTLVEKDPIIFLKQLQVAVGSTNTPPLSQYEELLSEEFDSLFGNGEFTDLTKKSDFAAAAQAAHALIVNRYLEHTGTTNWIHFTNIANWNDQVIDRASITEFIQYGNGIQTAAYYHAFKDGGGEPLDGSQRNARGYVLTFPAGELPQAERFWSVTAYTPDAIELVYNSEHKYLVASYTPGLEFNTDGSLSIYMATDLPAGVPLANWLPIPDGPFNIMLRIYGVDPNSDVANNTYVPPPIEPMRRYSLRTTRVDMINSLANWP